MTGRPVRPATCGQIPPAMQKGPSFPSPLASLDVCTSRGSPELDQFTGAAQQVKDHDMSSEFTRARKTLEGDPTAQPLSIGAVVHLGEAYKTIAQLQAELAEARKIKDQLMIAAATTVKGSMDEYKRGYADAAREVPGRIVDWLNSQPETLHHDDIAAAIEDRDWSKP